MSPTLRGIAREHKQCFKLKTLLTNAHYIPINRRRDAILAIEGQLTSLRIEFDLQKENEKEANKPLTQTHILL